MTLRSGRTLLLAAAAVGVLVGAVTGVAVPSQAPARQPPPLPQQFPSAEDRYLPGVRVDDLADWLTGQGYRCRTDNDALRSGHDAVHQLKCHAPSAHSVDASVWIDHDTPTLVRQVQASCRRYPTTIGPYCADLYTYTTGVVFDQQPDLVEQARQWATDHVDDDATTVLGDIELSTDLQRATLWLRPAG